VLNDSKTLPVTGPSRQDITYPFADAHSPIIGKSKKFHQMIAQIRSYADKERPVLIIGETGTGKELAARSLHSWSKRKRNPFVALNCAAIPPTLFESEMFGTERGAYTDAPTRSGAIEQAHNGTLFLDEIGNLSAASQPSLLRVLETKEYRRLGSTRSHSAQFRLVSASSLNLIDLAAEKCFRKDLLFRIADFILEIPPLRERTEDIPLLVRHFCRQLSKDIYDIEDSALDKLSAHDWPGNIRELQSVIARACARRITGKITADDIEFLTGISRLRPGKD
jgi:formate hydrogenlyase transcriptional activator